MDYDKLEKNVTVQRRDTSVPVRRMSGRAGSPGPSANDCSAISVESQADGGHIATGSARDLTEGATAETEGEIENPFAGSRRMSRTPPNRRGRHNSLPDYPGEKQMDINAGKPAQAVPQQRGHVEKIMSRRKLLTVSLADIRPHSAPTSPMESSGASDFALGEGEARLTKRRREESVPMQGLQEEAQKGDAWTANKINNIIDKINVQIETVVEVAKERNTKAMRYALLFRSWE